MFIYKLYIFTYTHTHTHIQERLQTSYSLNTEKQKDVNQKKNQCLTLNSQKIKFMVILDHVKNQNILPHKTLTTRIKLQTAKKTFRICCSPILPHHRNS